MFYLDPLYMIVAGAGFLLSMLASFRVKSAFGKYSKVRIASGLSGAQAAARMLEVAGVSGVQIVPTKGYLSDHYNPTNRTLALSEPVYNSQSIAAVGVACHEAGHAIQHSRSYKPLHLRSALVPTANIGSKFGMWGMVIGIGLLSMGGLIGKVIFLAGLALFSCVLAFQLITLPVEFDATARAKKMAIEAGIVSPQERAGMDKTLNAAALTYVAAAAGSLLTLLYFLFRAGFLGGRRD